MMKTTIVVMSILLVGSMMAWHVAAQGGGGPPGAAPPGAARGGYGSGPGGAAPVEIAPLIVNPAPGGPTGINLAPLAGMGGSLSGMPGGPGGMSSGMMMGMEGGGAPNPTWQAYEQMRSLAQKIKESEPKEREELIPEFRRTIAAVFDFDYENREKQLADLEKRVTKLKGQLAKRKEQKDKIIDLQIQVTINEADGLGFGMSNGTEGILFTGYGGEPAMGIPGAGGGFGGPSGYSSPAIDLYGK